MPVALHVTVLVGVAGPSVVKTGLRSGDDRGYSHSMVPGGFELMS